jgi:hypothetical protein
MSKEIESIAAALFDKIRSRFSNVTLGDEKAKAEDDPTKARFFNFTYTSEDGAEHGNVTLSLIDETSLKVYYGQKISGEMDREQRQEWYDFLRNLRKFAKRNLLTFDTRDINKSNLDLKDIKQQARVDNVATTADVTVTESRLHYSGTTRNTYANVGECRLLIRHDGLVNDDVRGARTRHIREIFIETPLGERFLLKHKNIDGAVATCHNLNAGGTINDDITECINNMVHEMNCMRHFVRSAKRRQFEDAETADMSQAAVHHYDQLKRQLRQMRGARGFKSYFETFLPAENPLEENNVDLAALKERFVKKVYDERFDEALPIVYREYLRQKNSRSGELGSELEEWANVMAESDWNTPDSNDKIRALQELLKSPVPVGLEGMDAIAKIEPIIGSDELNDQLYHDSLDHGQDFDATPRIKEWLQNNMPEVLSKIKIGDNNGRDDQTNWGASNSPQQANGNEYGSQPEHPNVSNMTMEDSDSLDFIRSLAGLKK